MSTMERMWINQPSKLQSMNMYHGKNVLAEKDKEYPTVYFTNGFVISVVVNRNVLEKGWKPI